MGRNLGCSRLKEEDEIFSENKSFRRVREAGEVRAQTEARIQVMSLAYSSVYGNKVKQHFSPCHWQVAIANHQSSLEAK